MNARVESLTCLALTVSFAVTSAVEARRLPKAPESNDFILRATQSEMADILSRNGLQGIECLGLADQKLCHVRAPGGTPPEQVIADITAFEPAATGIERTMVATLPETYEDLDLNQSTIVILNGNGGLDEVPFGHDASGAPRSIWGGYVNQDAAYRVDAHAAQGQHGGAGSVVAIIDTGIDPSHPLFDGHLIPGYDFLRDQPGDGSEWPAVDATVRSGLSQGSMEVTGDEDTVGTQQSTIVILNGHQRAQIDPTHLPPAFGHGTMVAGIVHRAAPQAGPDIVAALPDLPDDHALQIGKNVIEIKPVAANKGKALTQQMQHPDFTTRCPVMIGDDTTDEDAFAAATALGGFGIKMGDGETVAQYRIPTIPELYRLLEDLT